MKPLFTQEEFNSAKNNDKLPCECYICGSTFFVVKRTIVNTLHGSKNKTMYCSKICIGHSKKNSIKLNCSNCKKEINRTPAQIKDSKSNNHFCSKSCAAQYNNTHKTKGNRRSKLEIYLEQKLTELYPKLYIDYNKTNAINSELDIYIPSFKLAFQLNGIFHYEPIYGKEKLNRIQNNDNRKFQACAEKEIELCIIDTTSQKYFKEKTSIKFLDIITSIINSKLVDSRGC